MLNLGFQCLALLGVQGVRPKPNGFGGDWWRGSERDLVAFAEDGENPSLRSNINPVVQLFGKATSKWNPRGVWDYL